MAAALAPIPLNVAQPNHPAPASKGVAGTPPRIFLPAVPVGQSGLAFHSVHAIAHREAFLPLCAAWMAERAIRRLPGIARKAISDDHQEAYLEWRRRIGGEHAGKTVALEEAFEIQGLDAAYFDSLKSRLNASLRRQLGEALARHYEIQALARRRPIPFGLRLAPEQIRFIRDKRKEKAE